MIFKLIPRRAVNNRGQGTARIRNLINYIGNPETEDGREKCHYHNFLNLLSGNSALAIAEFIAAGKAPDCFPNARGSARNTSALIEHCVLSWQESETPSVRDVDMAARLFLRTFNPNALCMTGIHVNTENLHMHMAVQKYDPFGVSLVSGANLLPHWHAALAVFEKSRGFLPESNAIFQAHPLPNGDYTVLPRVGRSSRKWLEPVGEHLLPVLTFKGPEPFFPDFIRKGRHYYDKRNPEGASVMLVPAPGLIVIPGWRHPALPENLKRSTNNSVILHNVQEKEKLAGLRFSPEIITPESFFTAPRKKIRGRPDDVFIRYVDAMPPNLHISSREAYAAMHVLDLGFDKDSVGECLERHTRSDNDVLRPLHVKRALAFAERPLNRLKRPDFHSLRRKKWQARRYLEESAKIFDMTRRHKMNKKTTQAQAQAPVVKKTAVEVAPPQTDITPNEK